MYFDTDILLKYSDPTTADGACFLWVYHGLPWCNAKYLLNNLQKMNIGTDLCGTTEANWQKDGWRKKKTNVNTWTLPETGKPCCTVCISICHRALFMSSGGVQGKKSRPLLSESYMKQCESHAGLRVCTLRTLWWREAWAPAAGRLQLGGGRAQVGTFQVEWERQTKKPETEQSESLKLDMGMMSSLIQILLF